MAKSAGIVFARILVALLVLCGLGVGIYFLIINNINVKSVVYNDLYVLENSDNQKTLTENIGELENGEYFTFNKEVCNAGYENIYLSYYMDYLILDTYDNLLAYIGNKDNKKARAIADNLVEYQDKLEIAIKSQALFDDAKQGTSDVVANSINFKKLVKDFTELQKVMHTLKNNVFQYVTSTFYKSVDANLSEKYVLTNILNIQSNLLYNQIISEAEFPANLYKDSKEMVINFATHKQSNFTCQSIRKEMIKFLNLVNDKDKDFTEFYNSLSKVEYYNSATKESKADLLVLMGELGLLGRI